MHLAPIIRDLAVILATAGVVAIIFKKIRQPVVLGYLVAGVIIGPYTPPFPFVSDLPNIKIWAELGVIFLMFSLGLEFTFHKLVRVGGTAIGTAIVEVLGMIALGYGAGQFLGWNRTDSLFLGGMLSISSTVIIIKAFDALNLKSRRFAEIVFGVLIVEDLVAILLLVALSTVAIQQTLFSMEILLSGLKLLLVVGTWFICGYFLIPSFFKLTGRLADNETLTVLTSGLCLLLAVFATQFHYSPALGAFIMGSILGETREAHTLERLIQPLRDLFAAVFFVSVGMLMDPRVIWANMAAVGYITALTIFGKIVTCALGALIAGQSLKRSIQIGFSLAQIGEFSFIIAALGTALAVMSEFIYPIVVTVAVITTFLTPYLIRISERCADIIEKLLSPKCRNLLAKYSAWVQKPKSQNAVVEMLLRNGFRFALNGIIVSAIFLAISQYAVPELQKHIGDEIVLNLVSWVGGVVLSAPFVWGMFFAFHVPKPLEQTIAGSGSPYGFYYFLGQLSTVIWLGILSDRFFSTFVSLILTLLGSGVTFVLFYRRLESSYRWFEKQFLANFRENADAALTEGYLSSVLPWDLHLVKLFINPESAMAGQTLKEADVRSQFGLNIIVIKRGSRIIASPTAMERLLPGDGLLVLATDEQIEKFRTALEASADTSRDLHELSHYSLKQVVVEEDSALVGQTIRDSRIRENLKGLVVGFERGSLRTINPDPSLTLQPGDLLWVVGGIA